MSLDGSISASALFHDKDGTTTIKVVSLESVESPSSGIVAFYSGTCGTSLTSIDFSQYTRASGDVVSAESFASVTRIAFSATPAGKLTTGGSIPAMTIGSSSGSTSLVANPGFSGAAPSSPPTVQVQSVSGSAAYSIVLYGVES